MGKYSNSELNLKKYASAPNNFYDFVEVLDCMDIEWDYIHCGNVVTTIGFYIKPNFHL